MRALDGRVIVVTGVTSGIGRATARRLVAGGATVVGVARDADRLHQVAGELPGLEPEVCDLTDARQRSLLVARVLGRHPAVDGLVNNAAVGWQGMVADMGLADLERLVATNVVAVLDLTRMLLPGMLARGDGDIVMVTSVLAWMAAPPLTVYAATKAAVEAFADGLRREVWRQGVRVHIVRPGPVATEFMARSVGVRPREGDPRVRSAPGVAPARVAAAIERSLCASHPRRETVPRLLSVTQAVRVQPVRALADLAATVAGGRLVQLGRMLTRQRAPGRSWQRIPAPAVTTRKENARAQAARAQAAGTQPARGQRARRQPVRPEPARQEAARKRAARKPAGRRPLVRGANRLVPVRRPDR